LNISKIFIIDILYNFKYFLLETFCNDNLNSLSDPFLPLNFLTNCEKKWFLLPLFLVSLVFLYPSVKPTFKIKSDSLNAWRYSPENSGCSDANNLLFNVKSLSLSKFQKYGISNPDPKFLESEKEGGKKPDLLFTVGSGCANLGK